MRWSYRLGRVAGIDLEVHVTFLALLAWIGLSRLASGHGLALSALAVALVVTTFGVVVLHELGHALAARRLGIPTRNITLLPVGGVARLARIPERPSVELFVAAAGPAVNLVLAGVCGFALFLVEGLPVTLSTWLAAEFLDWLVVVNLVLLGFNLLPAFPMDGGRILRALLAIRLPYVRATEIAVRVGRGMALLLGLAGLAYSFMLVVIAFFVWTGGGTELAMVRRRHEPQPAWSPFGSVPGAAPSVVFVAGPHGWQAVRMGSPPDAEPRPSVRILDIQ